MSAWPWVVILIAIYIVIPFFEVLEEIRTDKRLGQVCDFCDTRHHGICDAERRWDERAALAAQRAAALQRAISDRNVAARSGVR